MIRLYRQIILLLTLQVISFTYTNAPGIQIIKNDKKYECIGYQNYNMDTNGEQLVISNFIHPNSTVFDIGASIGEWSKRANQHLSSGHIYAFEPIEVCYKKCVESLPTDIVSTFNLALGECDTTRTFIWYENSSAHSGFFRWHRMEKDYHKLIPISQEVTVQSLDSFCTEHAIDGIDFLKINTEGAEHLVLQGAKKLLCEQAISCIKFEYGETYHNAKTSLKNVYQLLTSHGYHVFRILPFGLLYIPQWHQSLETYRYSNYLALASSVTKLLFNKA